jgi:hypothetical protein
MNHKQTMNDTTRDGKVDYIVIIVLKMESKSKVTTYTFFIQDCRGGQVVCCLDILYLFIYNLLLALR